MFIVTLNSNYNDFNSAISLLYDTLNSMLSSLEELSSGINTLVTNYNTLDDGISTLYDDIDTLNSGFNELSNGTTQLRTETSDMDTQVQDTIDDMVQSIKGSDMETVSFVSSKNKDVKSVQFVIKTDSIEISKDTPSVEGSTEKLTLWQKFLNLFKR